jgi:hypothetical protein
MPPGKSQNSNFNAIEKVNKNRMLQYVVSVGSG